MIQTLLMQASGDAPPSAAPPSAAPPSAGTQQPAHQQPAGGLGGCAGGAGSNPLIMLGLIFVVFYFMLIRPQQKKQRDQDTWLKSLKKGDEVVTSGGLIGRISGLNEKDNTVTLELQEKVRVKVLRSHISGKGPAATAAAAPASTEADKK